MTAEAINPEAPETVDPEIVELVEDLVTTAILKASMDATKLMEDKMKAVTGGINIPGLF